MQSPTGAKQLPEWLCSCASHPVGVNQARSGESADANKPTKNTSAAELVQGAGTFSVPRAMTGPQILKRQEKSFKNSET